MLVLGAAALYGQGQTSSQQAQEQPKIEPLKTSITVSEKIDAEVPGVVSALDQTDIESRPGLDLDDRLRDVPGFSLFRRASSLVAHPTTQGISLRGLASSGTSRTLVLLDGLPMNDPFGGWVYWTRFNPDLLERIEISHEPSTSIFGDRAMGGVISVFTPTPEGRHFSGALEAGNAGVVDLHGGYEDLFGPVGISVFTRAFTTSGYYTVPSSIRGPVDDKAGVDFVVGDLRLDYLGSKQRLSLQTNILAEQRDNGTPLQHNSTSLGTIGLHYSREQLSLDVYHSRGEFRSGFSSLNATRTTERPTFTQEVPSEDTGAAGLWRHSSTPWNLVLGGDVHRASGVDRDTLFPTGERVGGGHLWQHGLFAQTDVGLGRRARLFAGLRHDFTGQGNTFLSPSAGLAVNAGPFRWRSSVFRSFRAPTLNELYRTFAVGNTVTQANANLRQETLTGGETGLDWQRHSVVVRSSLFWNSINDLVSNVTLSSAAGRIVRQRQNQGSATSRGAEVEVEKAFRRFRASAAYLFVDAHLDTSRLRLPEVAKHQGSAQVLYESHGTLASLGIRSYSLQFDDDLNTFLLPGFATVQMMVRQRLTRGFSLNLAVENLLDRTYLTALTSRPADPTLGPGLWPTIGAPRLWRAGVRWESSH